MMEPEPLLFTGPSVHNLAGATKIPVAPAPAFIKKSITKFYFLFQKFIFKIY